MKVVFELRKEKETADGLIPIQLVVRSESIRVRKNLGVSVKLEHWTGSRVKPNKKKEKPNNHEFINHLLQHAEDKCLSINHYLKANNIKFSKQIFDEKFEDKDKELTETDEPDFLNASMSLSKTEELLRHLIL